MVKYTPGLSSDWPGTRDMFQKEHADCMASDELKLKKQSPRLKMVEMVIHIMENRRGTGPRSSNNIHASTAVRKSTNPIIPLVLNMKSILNT